MGVIPEIRQVQQADCGAACLAMVLGALGRPVPLGVVQEVVSIDRDGADAGSLLQAAATFGLRGRAVSLELDELDALPSGAVLYWGFAHFVVFESASSRGIELVDPAVGRRRVSLERFRRSFTGVALLFEPVADYPPPPAERSRYWAALWRSVPGRALGRIVTVSLLLRGVALALPVLTGFVVDRLLPRGDRATLAVVVGGAVLIAAYQLVASVLRGQLLLELKSRLDLETHQGFLDHLMALPYSFFQKRSTGDLLMRVNSHSIIRELLTTATLTALLDGPLVLTWFVVLLLASPALALLVAGLAVLHLALFALGRTRTRELAAAEIEARSRAQSDLVQIIAGSETLKAQGAERIAVDRWTNLFVAELNASIRRGSAAMLLDAARQGLRTLAPLLVLALGALAVMDGELTVGALLSLAAVAAGVLEPLDVLVNHALQLQTLGGHVDRIDDVLRNEPEQPPGEAGRPPRLRGHVRLTGVGFRYGRGVPILQDIELDVPAGSSVAIVGPSGSGKSTLAKIVLGLYPPTAGSVAYDGVPLDQLELRSLRRQVGIVMQKPHLFPGSIRSNIALGAPEATLDEVRQAARLAGIEGAIEAMPMGFETLIGEDGDALSGGERQRLALARALLGKPRILLLDEATSALDTETEAQIMERLADLQCTRIVIAHRLSTIADADQILVVDGGRIVERGTHDDLLRRQGRYLSLVEAQT
jgi:ATP-binding cassette subfamily B protein